MRYQVNQKLIFIAVDYTAGRLRFGRLYCPWEDTLKSVNYILTNVDQHHKVPDCWDDGKGNPDGKPDCPYDGYILRVHKCTSPDLKEGTILHNQYPRASYGQISTEADYRARLVDFPDVVRDPQTKKLINEPHWLIDTDFEEVTNVLDRIERAVRSGEIKDEFIKQSLREWRDQIIQDLKTHFNAETIVGPLKLKRIDGMEEVFHDIPKFVVELPTEA